MSLGCCIDQQMVDHFEGTEKIYLISVLLHRFVERAAARCSEMILNMTCEVNHNHALGARACGGEPGG